MRYQRMSDAPASKEYQDRVLQILNNHNHHCVSGNTLHFIDDEFGEQYIECDVLFNHNDQRIDVEVDGSQHYKLRKINKDTLRDYLVWKHFKIYTVRVRVDFIKESTDDQIYDFIMSELQSSFFDGKFAPLPERVSSNTLKVRSLQVGLDRKGDAS